MSETTYILEIEWDAGTDLPRLIGPFDSDDEATQWGRLNIPNGTWNSAPLTYPHQRSRQRAS